MRSGELLGDGSAAATCTHPGMTPHGNKRCGARRAAVVTDPLAQFVGSLAPVQFDRTIASRRRKGIERLLSTASIKSDYLFESGSWSHGTAIAAKSDVDYMAWIDSERPSLPSSALARLRQVIDDSNGLDVYKVRTSSPVVSVEFYTDPHFEIVPAYYERSVGDTVVYWIPGRGDEWVLSAPDAHLAYVNRHNDRLGKKVKPLVRLMKAWKYLWMRRCRRSTWRCELRSTPPASPPSCSRST
jgi:hypothetical protein